ncbi:hypothetical protein [Burkholderia lata]|uniref:hypothetical protein n=1 Tax=Burkholderia lata (strain ATCC 17760 / DSM 23089 / LMG 22485 / NCIMB 9086 / R18194 / 383) TaxID=482957 RepID=UPI00399B0B5B
MNANLQTIVTELQAIADTVTATPEQRPLSIVYNNFGMAGIDRDQLASRASDLADQIRDADADEISSSLAEKLAEFPARLQYLRTSTIPHIFNGNANTAIPAYLITLDALDRLLRPILSVGEADKRSLTKEVSELRNNIRSLKARADSVEPKLGELEGMAKSIIAAHDAAARLPTDLQELEENQQKIQKISKGASNSDAAIRKFLEVATSRADQLSKAAEDADKIIEKCETALRASTAVGLAEAFHDRAESLRRSLKPWIAGLIGALVAGAYVGGQQLHQLAESIQASTAPTIVWTRIAVSLLSVGAPVWFAWLATKQIGQRFRLSEDYAYKASISKAYEGYRREAVDLDEDFQKRLFASALTRLDEQPLRFVESETHGSPWHELLSSDVVKDAIRIAPELVGEWKRKAVDTVAATKRRRRSSPKSANDSSVTAERVTRE